MADIELKRIVDLVAQSDIDDTVYTIIDSVSGAIKKYPIGSFICSVAPMFDATVAYTAGNYCNYGGQLYKFTAAHAAGSWTGSDAIAVSVAECLETTGDAIGELNERLDGLSSIPAEVKVALFNLLSTAAYADTGLSDDIDTIETWALNHATAISLSPSSATLNGITTQTITPTLTPSDTTDTVVWTSSDTDVATVTNGVVSSIGNGTCTITATAGSVSATCSITVTGVSASYTVSNTLSNCTNSNNAERVVEGGEYSATITAASGYLLMNVVVTMGGDDVTSTVYSNGVIDILEVTGNITVYATASAITVVSPTWTRGSLGSTGSFVNQKWYGAYVTDMITMGPNQTLVIYSTDPNWTTNYTGSDGNGKTGNNSRCCFFQNASSPSYINPTILIDSEKSMLIFKSSTASVANYSKTVGAKVHVSNLVDYLSSIVVGIVDGV